MPMSESLKPKLSSPIAYTVALIFDSTCAELIYNLFPFPYLYANIFV